MPFLSINILTVKVYSNDIKVSLAPRFNEWGGINRFGRESKAEESRTPGGDWHGIFPESAEKIVHDFLLA